MAQVWDTPGDPLIREADDADDDSTTQLLLEAYTRLMVSEGDARYIASNVELAGRIKAALEAAGHSVEGEG